jgi:hypothetical protein
MNRHGMSLAKSPRPMLTSNRARIAKRSKCCSRTSSESSSLTDCDCADRVALTTSFFWRQPYRTYDEWRSVVPGRTRNSKNGHLNGAEQHRQHINSALPVTDPPPLNAWGNTTPLKHRVVQQNRSTPADGASCKPPLRRTPAFWTSGRFCRLKNLTDMPVLAYTGN